MCARIFMPSVQNDYRIAALNSFSIFFLKESKRKNMHKFTPKTVLQQRAHKRNSKRVTKKRNERRKKNNQKLKMLWTKLGMDTNWIMDKVRKKFCGDWTGNSTNENQSILHYTEQLNGVCRERLCSGSPVSAMCALHFPFDSSKRLQFEISFNYLDEWERRGRKAHNTRIKLPLV